MSATELPAPADAPVSGPSDRLRELLEGQRRAGSLRGRGWLVRRALLAGDVLGLAAAFVTVQLLFGIGHGGFNFWNLRTATLLYLFSLPGWLLVAKLLELYDHDEERAGHTTVDDLARVVVLVTLGGWAFFAGTLLVHAPEPNYRKLIAFWALTIAAITGARALARALCRRAHAYRQRAVVMGAGDVGQLIARKLRLHPEYGIELVGFVDSAPVERAADLADVPVLGSPEVLPALVRSLELERVIVAFAEGSTEETIDLVRVLKRLDIQIDIVPRLYEALGPNVDIHRLESLPLVGLPSAKLFPFSRTAKRVFDVVGAGIGLILASPLFVLIALAIKRDSDGPVFFGQTRLGLNMREFTALKFRTMNVGTDDAAHRAYIKRTMDRHVVPDGNGLYKLERNDAVTRVGRLLRRTSLDELPQLWNVLRGDMSLVGPRPCLPYEAENFADHHFERFLVPAGLTGLWQVTARAHSTFGEALDIDVAYARNWSLGLDLWVLLRTPFEVLRRTATA